MRRFADHSYLDRIVFLLQPPSHPLKRSDGTVLVEVAACDGNQVGSTLDAVCRLPDTKKDRDADLPHNAMNEILKARMPCLIGILEGPPEVRVEREIDADTARVGVQRHTIRRTFSVHCNDQCVQLRGAFIILRLCVNTVHWGGESQIQ